MKLSTRMVVLGRKLWTPAALGSSLALWLDADDFLTITLNGSTVSQWRDKSGNARHASQASAANQPTYTLNGLNSRAVINFSPPNLRELITPSFKLGQTITTVAQRSDASQCLMEAGSFNHNRGLWGNAYPDLSTHLNYGVNGGQLLTEAPNPVVNVPAIVSQTVNKIINVINTLLWSSTATTVVENTTETTAPDGTNTAEKITFLSSAQAFVSGNKGGNFANTTYELFAKAGPGATYIRMDNGSGSIFRANLTGAGEFGLLSGYTDASITALSNGWYQISLTTGSTAGSPFQYWNGNEAGGVVYIWGLSKPSTWVLGRGTPAYSYLNGFISEIVATNELLSTTDRQRLEGYLAHKWGLIANLPGGHPFKFTPPYI